MTNPAGKYCQCPNCSKDGQCSRQRPTLDTLLRAHNAVVKEAWRLGYEGVRIPPEKTPRTATYSDLVMDFLAELRKSTPSEIWINYDSQYARPVPASLVIGARLDTGEITVDSVAGMISEDV